MKRQDISYKRRDYALKKTANSSSVKRKTSYIRRKANGKGTIEKTKNNMNPYKVKVPIETYLDGRGKVQVRYKCLGYFPTKGMAENALEEFNRTPYDLSNRIVSFSELYEAWSKEYFQKLGSTSSIRTITSAYAYCSGLYHMKIRQIGAGHIKDAMNHGFIIETKGKHKGERKYASLCTQERIKSMCNLMFDYALERNLVMMNPARSFKINDLLDEIQAKAKKKKPFSAQEVKILWKYHQEFSIIDIILVGIYSGFRPQELVLLQTENIHLEQSYMVGGMKTENGRNRIVPIHPEIKTLIEFYYDQAKNVYKSAFLFNLRCGSVSKPLTYNIYQKRFQKVMSILNLIGYTPHCTRHTFATQAEICEMRDWAIKLIMGHSLNGDVTNLHYKHTGFDYLFREICKLTYKTGEEDGVKC